MKKTLRKHLWTFSAFAGALAIFLQVNSVALVTVLFSVNQQQIAATQCEKKTAHCNGQCFLKKQMKAATEETPGSNPNERTSHVPSISSEYVESSCNIALINHRKINPHFQHSASTIAGFGSSVFNPPKRLLVA